MRVETINPTGYSGTYTKSAPTIGGSADSIPVETQTAPAPQPQQTVRQDQPVVQTPSTLQDMTHKRKAELSMDEKNWIDVIERANKAINGATCNFEFSIHKGTKEIMIKIIDKDTKEVIREIPPEKILDMVAKMWEMAGIMVDERR